jgi:plasmid stabilization system protein ParE
VPRLLWAPSAIRDLARLHGFLAPKNRVAARAIRSIRQGVRLLARHPEIGRPVEELPPEFHEWFIRFGDSGYVALYRYDGALITILSVRHAKEAGY